MRQTMVLRTGWMVAAIAGMFCSAALGAAKAPDAFSQNKRLGRGVNVLGYDPIWKNRERARFQEKHFRLIREAGFDSVRINLHPFRDAQMGADHKLGSAWFETLDWAVKHALENKLLVVVDLHEFQAMGKDPTGNKERFLAVWRQLADHFQNAPSEVLFEILNEPSEKLTPELWNSLLREALAIIRQKNPNRTVIIGPGSWNNINALAKLELPADDRNLIATVHYYNPFEFTHQGTSWTNLAGKVGVAWSGSEREKKAIEADFAIAQAWSKQHNRPLLLGEFGAFDKAEMASRVRWTSHVVRHAEKLGWSWAYWQFDGDFILYDMKQDGWVEPIRQALAPR